MIADIKIDIEISENFEEIEGQRAVNFSRFLRAICETKGIVFNEEISS